MRKRAARRGLWSLFLTRLVHRIDTNAKGRSEAVDREAVTGNPLSIAPLKYALPKLIEFWEDHVGKGAWVVQADRGINYDIPACQWFLTYVGYEMDGNYKLRHWGSVERNNRKPDNSGREPDYFDADGTPVFRSLKPFSLWGRSEK